MKSFPITKEMRADIAKRLTSKAVTAEVDAIDAEAKRINKLFWRQYEKNLRAASGVPSTKWPELIRIGMVNTVLAIMPRHKVKARSNAENGTDYVFTIPMYRGDLSELKNRTTNAVWSKLLNWFGRKWGYDLHLQLTASKTLPAMNGGSLVEDPALISDIKRLQTRVEKLLSAVDTFHTQTISVLASCRTAKQMRELFPEGAKLLPQPEEKSTQLAPTELAASVTEMLRKGVPPIETSKDTEAA